MRVHIFSYIGSSYGHNNLVMYTLQHSLGCFYAFSFHSFLLLLPPPPLPFYYSCSVCCLPPPFLPHSVMKLKDGSVLLAYSAVCDE